MVPPWTQVGPRRGRVWVWHGDNINYTSEPIHLTVPFSLSLCIVFQSMYASCLFISIIVCTLSLLFYGFVTYQTQWNETNIYIFIYGLTEGTELSSFTFIAIYCLLLGIVTIENIFVFSCFVSFIEEQINTLFCFIQFVHLV